MRDESQGSAMAVAIAVVAVAIFGSWLGALAYPAYPNVAAAAVFVVVAAVAAVSAWRWWVRLRLAEAAEARAALFQAATEPLALLDAEGRVVEANAAAEAAFGGGKPMAGAGLFDQMESADAAAHLQQVLECRRGGRPTQFIREASGVRRRYSVVPFVVGERRMLAVYAIDVTAVSLTRAVSDLAADMDRRMALGEPLADVLRRACAAAADIFDARYAWIGRKDEGGAVGVVVCAGRDMDCDIELRRAGHRWDDAIAGRGPVGNALRQGEAQVYQCGEGGIQDWQKVARRHAIRSILSLPLKIGSETRGVLTLNAQRAGAFDDAAVVALAGMVASRAAAALALSEDRQRSSLLTAGLEAAANGVFVADAAGTIVWVNQAFVTMCGYPRHEILGRNPRVLRSGAQDAAFYQDMWQTILAGNAWTSRIVDQRKDGTQYVANQTITPVRGIRGDIANFVAIQVDVTQQLEMEDRLNRMAQYDGLTDLPNRALLLDRLGLGIAAARRNKHSLAVLYLDINNFKLVNDGFGLPAGDALLRAFAARLGDCVRQSDTAARLSGDTFAVILPQVLLREDSARVAQKILEAMRPVFDIEGHDVQIRISIGIALFPQDGDEQHQLLARAESALRVVKMQQGNAFRFASS